MAWTESEIPDLSGKTVFVTGGNSGIGYEAARMMCARGAKVILGCRSERRARLAVTGIDKAVGGADISTITLDLSDLDSVRAAATKLAAEHDKLDILVNNAGLMAIPFAQTAQGFEMQLGVNHLGHFALTGLLLELVEAAPAGRIVTVSSNAHRRGEMDFDDLHSANKPYSAWATYSQSKLANLLFTYALQRRLAAKDSRAMAVACHPGLASTNLFTATSWWQPPVVWLFSTFIAQDSTAGAWPTVFAAVDPTVKGGDYIGPDGPREMWGPPKKTTSLPQSHVEADQERLWEISVEATEVGFETLEAT